MPLLASSSKQSRLRSTSVNSPDRVSPWIKAKASDTGSSCVQQRRNGDRIEIRDSKHPGGPVLTDITLEEFRVWIEAARHGEFDHLLM